MPLKLMEVRTSGASLDFPIVFGGWIVGYVCFFNALQLTRRGGQLTLGERGLGGEIMSVFQGFMRSIKLKELC